MNARVNARINARVNARINARVNARINARTAGALGAALLGALLFCTVGCKDLASKIVAQQSQTASHYHMQGMVLGASAVTRQVTIEQDAIRDFMPAMNAVYAVRNARVLQALKPGDQIEGEVLEPANGNQFRLEDIAIKSQPRAPIAPSALPPHQLLLGEAVPDVPLVDQNGRPVDFSRYRGQAVLLTFIDSRCTDDCPILTARFARIDRLLHGDPKAYVRSHLMSISIDPAYDTPPVLRRYGLGYLKGNAAGFSHWEFVRLTPANLKGLATDFGVVYYPTKDDIDHTMTTALIGPEGMLLKTWSGDEWDPATVEKAVAAAALKAQTADSPPAA
ncbi:MAG: SCO family protein [Terracidiphilus sp.]